MRNALFLLLLLCVGCSGFGRQTPIYYDIGVVHRAVTTDSDEAQLWFDRGLALTYGFNHEEAIRCYERAIEADPTCAMAYWGIAYALGPNYNNVEMTAESSHLAFETLEKAYDHLGHCSEVEQDLIRALGKRYPTRGLASDRTRIERAYADAMQNVWKKHPNDADVAALTAEAIMMKRPWKLWSPEGVPAPETGEVRAVLEPALKRWPEHPALCHLYIHTMEAGPEVEAALPAARTLENLVPGAGHLVHMPSHIYAWTGRYADMIRVNQRAVELDRAYADYAGRNNFYTLYRIHNYHFVAYGAMFEGRRELALEAARELVTEIPPELLAEAADFVDIFVATPYHVMVRFGMWDEILEEQPPAEDLVAARSVWHYARGVAYASLGRVDEAAVEQRLFLSARAEVPETRYLFNNPVHLILGVAEQVLAGEIEYRRKNYDVAFKHLRRAVELDLALNYDEPWGWMEPARHPLGALLTEQGHYDEAIEVYQADLKRFPENGWALRGLAECMEKSGRDRESAAISQRFRTAWKRADVQIEASCFCAGRE